MWTASCHDTYQISKKEKKNIYMCVCVCVCVYKAH